MADDILEGQVDTEDGASHHTDASEGFLRHIEQKYGKDDDANRDREDGVEASAEDDDAGEGGDNADEHGDGDQTDSGTSSSERDGADEESDEESTGDDADQPEGESDEDAEPEDDADGTEGEDDDEAGVSDELKAAAGKHNIPVTLDDIADPTARSVVEQKLKLIDAGFTKAMQEARAYRSDEARFRAEQKFQKENADLYVAQLLLDNPDLFDKVNARMEKLGDDDQKEAFKIVVKDKRQTALESVTAEMGKAERLNARADHVETFTRTSAAKRGLPWELAEQAVYTALMSKPEDQRDLSDAEIEAAVTNAHKVFEKATRGMRREGSKQTIQARTANRKPGSPVARPGKGASTPTPARAAKPKELDPHDSEGRIDRIMTTVRRLKPGTK